MDTQRQSAGAQTVSFKTISGVGFSGAKRGRPAWFDIRVIYVRLSSCLAKSAPDCFRIIFPVRSLSTAFEVNGARVAPSDQTSRALRRDRVDRDSAEATYVSTNNLRTNGDLPFELHHRGEVLVTGKFLRSDSKGPVLDNHTCSFTTRKKPWIMECNCALSGGSSFLSTKTEYSVFNAPFMEVYVAGRSLGQPIVLNQMVHLLPRRKIHSHTRCISLEAIPEDDDETGNATYLHTQEEVESEMEMGNYSHSDRQAGLEIFYCGGGGGEGRGGGFDDVEGEEGELTWFNAGVRVGMGIGLGICLGVGVGVGLVMRTYQATTGRFRRRLL